MRKFVRFDSGARSSDSDLADKGVGPVVEVTEADRRIHIAYRFPGFFTVERVHDIKGERRTFEAIDVAGVGHLMDSGKPQLPSFGRYVQIPPGSTYTVKVSTPGDPLRFDNIAVAPAQAKLTDAVAGHELEYDEVAYASGHSRRPA